MLQGVQLLKSTSTPSNQTWKLRSGVRVKIEGNLNTNRNKLEVYFPGKKRRGLQLGRRRKWPPQSQLQGGAFSAWFLHWELTGSSEWWQWQKTHKALFIRFKGRFKRSPVLGLSWKGTFHQPCSQGQYLAHVAGESWRLQQVAQSPQAPGTCVPLPTQIQLKNSQWSFK